MAAKAPGGKKRPRRKRKLRLTLRQNKIKKADSYTDSLDGQQMLAEHLRMLRKQRSQKPSTFSAICVGQCSKSENQPERDTP